MAKNCISKYVLAGIYSSIKYCRKDVMTKVMGGNRVEGVESGAEIFF
jgi:hypothetical protein